MNGTDPATVQAFLEVLAEDPLYKVVDGDSDAVARAKGEALQAATATYLQSLGLQGPCAEQLDPVAFGLDIASAAADVAGLIAEAIGAIIIVAEIPGIVIQAVGTGLTIASVAVEGVQNSQPNCNAEFTGTVVAQSNIIANMGISAHDGRINLGDASGVNYTDGITLGGGSLLGAGFGGAQANTGDASAIAVGNGANAGAAGSLALGLTANATGANSSAVGNGAQAGGS
ncbi:MAG: hypothetical protein ABL996_20400, partial [Micropepsaceae bacterium]